MRARLVCRQLKDLVQRMEQVHVALVHLNSQMHLVACFDLGINVGLECVLPVLQVGRECLVLQAGVVLLQFQCTEAVIGGHEPMATGPSTALTYLESIAFLLLAVWA